MRLLCAVLVAAAAVAVNAADSNTAILAGRYLEDGSSYVYLDDVSGYSIKYNKCVRVKIPQNNDDDAEGNNAFYNGRYHAQYHRYASFFLCNDSSSGDDSSSSSSTCNVCDTTTEYVTQLETYLEAQVEYVKDYCEACAECGRRRVEDQEGEEGEEDGDDGGFQIAADCNTCADQCELLLNKNDDANALDESDYIECQEAYQDEDSGVQYYSGLQCGSSSEIIVGLFYDDECTVRTKTSHDYSFNYYTFHTIEKFCVQCDQTDGACDELYQEASHCVDGYDLNEDGGDEDMPICKTFKSANTVRTFNKRKKSGVWPIAFIVTSLLLVGGFVGGSYTYYVRHKNHVNKEPLASLDHESGGEDQNSNSAKETELPPIS